MKNDNSTKQSNASKPMLSEVYPYIWSFEFIANDIYYKIREILGEDFIKENYTRVFEKYVSPYFTTWDNFSSCTNCDRHFTPVVFSMYAEKINVKPQYPVRIMREVTHAIQNLA
jgi:hypothetical protein